MVIRQVRGKREGETEVGMVIKGQHEAWSASLC